MIDISIKKDLGFDIPAINRIIKRVVAKTFEELNISKKHKPYYLSILLTDNSEIAKLNKKYAKKNKATNVLSFPQNILLVSNAEKSTILLGDIVLSLEMIRFECTKQNKTFENHLSHMTLHGLLHLYGFTHNDTDDSEKMEKVEQTILSKISILNPITTKNAEKNNF